MPHDDMVRLEAEVLGCREIHELPGGWGADVLRGLLADLEIETENVAESDLLDLALMAVGDLDPHEAGIAVLRAVFGDGMPAGVRSNLASDLQEDRPWEEFADLSRQEGIFTATVLLQKAQPKMYGTPDATRVEVALRADSAQDAPWVAALTDAQLLRALAPGLGPRSILTRLYAEGLRGGPFPEAEHILWRRSVRPDPADPRCVVFTFFGSQPFLEGLKEARPWQVEIEKQ